MQWHDSYLMVFFIVTGMMGGEIFYHPETRLEIIVVIGMMLLTVNKLYLFMLIYYP